MSCEYKFTKRIGGDEDIQEGVVENCGNRLWLRLRMVV